MIPTTISAPARAAQDAVSSDDAKRHQLEALAAAWRWGFEEFKRKPHNLWLDREEASRRWVDLAGEEPYCGCRGPVIIHKSSSSNFGCCGEGFARIMA